ncbi:hypothetical protein J2Z62_000643 [Mycoplasmoides fastidiosum]|uniref:Uncharacterized protein n=1 Tax=Mycoplasmoides fastidiosum TaxID=92758 RepID=A0ABU0LZS4_9BACT|nr:hypothetical protein [Mycoplasmoides fastidiosum]MDQ0514205.1 hypothetical protein [Mycoplasmoides fastidiosum]UUD37385.1 hypothetical protein NPA10_02265 [Mycoplasmoides fastidiosum]
MLIGDKPFLRIVEPRLEKEYQQFVEQIKPFYNENNFTKIYIRSIYDMVNTSQLEYLEIYLFSLLYTWTNNNEKYNYDYLKDYQKLVDFLEIENKFGFLEHYYFERLNMIVFTITRKLKSLNPDFPMSKKEANYFFYADLIFQSHFSQFDVDKLGCNLFITNKRLILASKTMYLVFRFNELKQLKLNFNNVYFEFEDLAFSLETIAPEVVYISLDRIIQSEGYDI